jgi:hypothetical protein
VHSEAAVITTAKAYFLVIKAHSSFKEVSGSKLSPHTGYRQAKNIKFEAVDAQTLPKSVSACMLHPNN